MEVTEDKVLLRTELRTAREAYVAQLDSAARLFAFRAPPTPLKELIERAHCIAAYRATEGEADPASLLAYAVAQGKMTALPHVERRSVPLRFLAWAPGGPLVDGPFGLQQPPFEDGTEVEPDLFLAPLLGFDRRLHRIGQGAGYYDRAFARYPDAVRVGIAWSAQEVDWVPVDPWDVPLHAVLTEREWIV